MTDTAYLERALIGCLLLHPERAPDTAGLTTHDFTDPLCHALWTVLDGSARPAGPANTADIADTLQRSQPDVHPNLRTPAAIAELTIHAPKASNVDTYAKLIADATTRRDVISLGYQLTQIAANADDAPARIETIRQRLHQTANRHASIDLPEDDRTSCSRLDRYREVRPDRHPLLGRERVMAEYAVVGAAIHNDPPGSRRRVRSQVTADQLLTPRMRAAWDAVDALQSLGLAVDEITVHWQLRRTGASPLPGIQELRDLNGWSIHLEPAIAHLRQANRRDEIGALDRMLQTARRSGQPSTAVLLRATGAASRDPAQTGGLSGSVPAPDPVRRVAPSRDRTSGICG